MHELNTSALSPEALREYERLALWSAIWGPGGLELAASLATAMALPAGSRVLDAGGGSGEIACFLAEHFGWRVTLLDFDVSFAQQKIRTRGLSQRVQAVSGDMLAPPFGPACFDGVFCQGSLEMLEGRRSEGVRALVTTLRPGGVFGLAEPMLRREMSVLERLEAHGHDFAAPFWTLQQNRALLEAAGLHVHTAAVHPESARLWDEFVGPWFTADGQLKRPEVRAVAEGWRRDGGRWMALGVVTGLKR